MWTELSVNFEHIFSMVESSRRLIIGSSIFLPDLLNRQDLVWFLQVNIYHFSIGFLDLLSQIKLIILILTDLNRFLSIILVNRVLFPHRLRPLIYAVFAPKRNTFAKPF